MEEATRSYSKQCRRRGSGSGSPSSPPGDVGHRFAPGREDHPVSEADDRAVVGLQARCGVSSTTTACRRGGRSGCGDAGPRLPSTSLAMNFRMSPHPTANRTWSGAAAPGTVDLPQVARIVDEDAGPAASPAAAPRCACAGSGFTLFHPRLRSMLVRTQTPRRGPGSVGSEAPRSASHPISHQDRLDVAAADRACARRRRPRPRDAACANEIVRTANTEQVASRRRRFRHGDGGTRFFRPEGRMAPPRATGREPASPSGLDQARADRNPVPCPARLEGRHFQIVATSHTDT